MRFYLIGIKGTGMSALAISLKQLGNDVIGSDVAERFFTDESLEENNIEFLEFNEDNITGEDLYIISAAYDYKNVEVNKILKNKWKYYYYHDFIEQYYKGIKVGVSGTHGKTTTTRLITHLINDNNTSAIIGDGVGIGNKDYLYFVIEACEYKNHFLQLTYDYLVINNIDFDHPDFFVDINDVIKSFEKVSKKTKNLIINGDDNNCKKIIHKNMYTFGLNKENYVCGEIEETLESGYKLKVFVENETYTYYLPFLGQHMIYNFLASFTVNYLLTKNTNIQEKLIKYKNPRRRMEEYSYYDNVIIDDYAHHPTEIKACIDTIKLKHKDKKLIVFFEPHTYSRTLALAYEFSNCFVRADELYLAKTFTSKREKYNAVLEKEVVKLFPTAKRFNQGVIKKIKNYHNCVIVFMGAGNIRKNIATIIHK